MPMLDSYLFFNGNCAEAMRFYQSVIGGEMQAMMTYGESPEPQDPNCTPADKSLIMHACLVIDGRMLMASDTPPGAPGGPAKPGGFSLSLSYPTADEAKRIYEKLSVGGQVIMPMGPTFWAHAFGMFTDKFGTPWMVGGGDAMADKK